MDFLACAASFLVRLKPLNSAHSLSLLVIFTQIVSKKLFFFFKKSKMHINWFGDDNLGLVSSELMVKFLLRWLQTEKTNQHKALEEKKQTIRLSQTKKKEERVFPVISFSKKARNYSCMSAQTDDS